MLREILEYFRDRLDRIRLYRPPPERGLWPFIRRRISPPVRRFDFEERSGIFLNRYCNLSCFSCGALGMNPPPDETTLDEIEAYLTNIEGYNPGITFMLTGGEPTAVDHDKLRKVCELIHERGYTTALLTNGYRLIPTDWIDYIMLDKHGINDVDIAKWEAHLRGEKRDIYEYRDKKWHMDIPYAMEGNITEGVRCGSWMTSLTLWKDVVYPCCNLMCVAWWHGDIDQNLAGSLRDAGWSAFNPDLVDTIRNWRETLPGEVYRMCSIKCWREASKTRWVKIT